MPVSAFTKFHQFAVDAAAGVHVNVLNTDTDVVRFYLSNTAPNVATHAVKADLAEIATGGGYSGAIDVENARSIASGVIKVVGVDKTITATAGGIATFRYVVLYNDTPTSPADPLIGYWDNGAGLTLAETEEFVVDLQESAGMFTFGG